MAEAMEVQDLLRQLRNEGQLDSGGQFTVDMTKATPKLERFLLANPYHYGLKLVQAGVAAGAERIEFDVNDRKVRVRLLGARFEVGDLRKLFGYLLDVRGDRSNRGVRHLAVGINGMVSLGASQIRMDGFDGSLRYRSLWKRGSQQSSDGFKPRWSQPYLEIEMIRSGRDAASGLYQKLHSNVFGLATASREVLTREEATLVDRGFSCPVPLLLNRRSLSAPYTFTMGQQEPHPVVEISRLEVPMQDDRASGLRLPKSSGGVIFGGPRRPGEPVLALLLLGNRWREQSRLLVVEDGVFLSQELVYLGHPGVTAVMCGSLFTRDMTGLAVTRDEFYMRNLAALGRWARELREETRQNWRDVEVDGLEPNRLLESAVKRALPFQS